jgi:hypothetical protein
MSIDPGLPINISVMAAAFAADAILSALLIFLWLMQPKEKHALFWGLGQLAIMTGSILWFLGGAYLSDVLRLTLCAILLCLGMAGWRFTPLSPALDGDSRHIHERNFRFNMALE